MTLDCDPALGHFDILDRYTKKKCALNEVGQTIKD